jgi:NADH:ubiquinone oxidoreductase subunit F (NADH-binding)
VTAPAAWSNGLPRLFTGLRPDGQPLRLSEHLACYGAVPSPRRSSELIDAVERAGLTGRGGAGFPVAVKMRAVVRAGRRGVVVGNGAEGEPASEKDRCLLIALPHLVLDGLAQAADAVGAEAVHLVVPPEPPVWHSVRQAAAERMRARCDRLAVNVHPAPTGYTASQDSALCRWLSGGPAKPQFTPPYPAARGVQRRPTLVQNVETLAQLALIARHGSDWFRALGTVHAPGSVLVTIGGAVRLPGVYEVALGTPLNEVIGQAAGLRAGMQAVLTGGYLGGWLPAAAVHRTPYTAADLAAAGGAIGPGVLVVLPDGACGLAETARVVAYMASQGAGQCGPCVFGLPALADALSQLAWQGRDPRMPQRISHLCDVVAGRGACHHPDGTITLAGSALQVFGDDVRQHANHGPCPAAHRADLLPIPTQGAT